ncbi:M48 family metallopeptidase [Collimonas pratensis]|uniref:M48 family metallopeptidase n=1 Tax=Collimonas pratensis TaxID=279113 RepID=UPI000BFF789D|nr:SprT family zinc-dependent metalloprotease [Collimonas pratensis]
MKLLHQKPTKQHLGPNARPQGKLPQQQALQLDLFADDSIVSTPPAPPTPNPRTNPRATPQPPTPPAADAGALAPGKRRLRFGEHVLDYTLLRSKRRSIGFLISDDGLRVTAPKWVTLGDIEVAIREKKRWIFTKLSEYRDRSTRRMQPQMQWRDGETLPYMGRSITLRIHATQKAGIHFDDASDQLIVCLPADAGEQQLKDRVLGWLQLEAKRVFGERLPIYAEKLGVTYQSFALSSATTQWGSCTSEGKIRLNWRLMHFALPLIDYVIAHELSHLREMNHSPRFWATVQSIFPEFETARKTLRDSAQETLPVF